MFAFNETLNEKIFGVFNLNKIYLILTVRFLVALVLNLPSCHCVLVPGV